MKIIKTYLLVFFALLASASVRAETTIQTRIVGGTEVPSGSAYPWMVLLSSSASTSDFFCGGSLIDDRWVMTAAHCVDGDSGSVYAFVGEYDRTDPGDSSANLVDKIIIHPDYNASNSDNDIALLRLTNIESITPVTLITPTLAATFSAIDDDTIADVTVMGWGDTETIVTYPDVLHEVDLPLISNSVCNQPQALGGQVTSNMLCAGLAAGGIDSCQGDSGGPLVYYNAGNWYQAGIVSWGEGCADPNKYGVYTRVENYLNWIELSKTFTSSIDFTTWISGKNPVVQIEIDNSTQSAFSINSVISSNNSIFQVGTSTCNAPVAVGETCTIDVHFSASATGSYAGSISIETDSMEMGTASIPVSGRIVSPVMFTAVNLDNTLEWAVAGDKNWVESNSTFSGYVLQSGNVLNTQSSSVFTYVNIPPAGADVTLHFDWRACSEPYYDYLQLWVDYKKVDALSGNVDWYHKTVTISGEGDHIIEWRYDKDYIYSVGDDSGWLANVSQNVSLGPAPVHLTSCDQLDVYDEPLPTSNSGGGGGAISLWLLFGLGAPIFLRRREH